jgi:23S rRNA pseudouridine1911/1915/1917 synthase
MRLDRFLLGRTELGGLGRRGLAILLRRADVRVNDRPARKGTIVRAGDRITFDGRATTGDQPVAPAPLTIAYEDDDLLVIDKPAGMPTTTGRSPGPSVAAALLAHDPAMATFGDARHAGLVHRLDTGTSGLLIAARHGVAHARLRAAFASKRAVKEYLAVVHGRLTSTAVVDTPLARHRRSRSRMVAARGGRGWPARTEIEPIGGDATYTVVRLRMRTGVTHQLRAHLAMHGHPILGDRRYGRDPASALAEPSPDGWHYLHARAIAFDDATLPSDLAVPFPAHWRPLFEARRWTNPAEA